MTRPLFNETAEQAVLAAAIIDTPAAQYAVLTLDAAMFYSDRHRRIFDAMTRLVVSGTRVDPVTVANVLTERGHLDWAGGMEYLGFLTDAVPTAANVAYHAGIVAEFASRRALLNALTAAADELRDGAEARPAREVARTASAALLPFTVDDTAADGFLPLKQTLYATLEGIEARAKGVTGLVSGYARVDAEVGAFYEGELLILGGAEKMGKSAAALNLALRIASKPVEQGGGGVGYVSAEMTRDTLQKRCIAWHSRVDGRRLRTGQLVDMDWPRVAHSAGVLTRLPFWIDDEAEPSTADVVARCTALKAEHPEVRMIVVDFLQLIHSREKGIPESVELKRIAYALKGMAKRLKVFVVAPCQVNTKDIEDGKDPRPRAKDLQGSSGMRQAADFVALLYRPAVYDTIGANPYELELNFTTCREAAPFLARLRWDGATQRIDDFDAPPPIAGTASFTLPDRKAS